MATDKEKQQKTKISELGKLLEKERKEVVRLVNIEEELKKQKVLSAKVNEDMKLLEQRYGTLSRENQQFRKDIEKFKGENTDDLKLSLKTKDGELSDSVKEISQLKKQIAELTKKNESLVQGDKSNSGLLDDLKAKGQEIEKLERDKAFLQKKVDKTEGEFPKLPVPVGRVSNIEKISEILMDSEEKTEVHRITFKNEPSLLFMQVHIKGNKCVDVRYFT